MINEILLYTGSLIIFSCGITHIVLMKPVINGFGQISEENKQIIKMGWTAESLILNFIGVLVLFVTICGGSQEFVSKIVYWISAVLLIIMAGSSSMIGARISIDKLTITSLIKKITLVHLKGCPIIKTSVAMLFLLGSIL